ncbi:hypothetical protein CRG98_028551 [Punica granatum]|uniref:Uncharacterized protein n=1 Tax=Punica granatum TaxID=22663 RepID=A0A2I0J4T4_PUNGR|nr:hypothetical protein CRG98_028551 [Punica granatum]
MSNSFEDLECLNDEDLNEPNIATRRVNERSGDSAPRECSGIVVISVFRGRAPKARRETFMTTETSLGKPSRVPEGHLKLVPRPWWFLGACRPVLGVRLLVSGVGPGSSVKKGVHERSRCPSSCGLPRKCVRTCHWSLWH